MPVRRLHVSFPMMMTTSDDEDGRAKEAAKKPNRRAKKKGFEKPDADAGANMIRCSMCKLTFASGNALHKHLKDAHSGVHKKKR